jgi:hypothetical protein
MPGTASPERSEDFLTERRRRKLVVCGLSSSPFIDLADAKVLRLSDRVGSSFVANLRHPGGKITGSHNFELAIGGKWLAYLSQIAPAGYAVLLWSTFRKSHRTWPFCALLRPLLLKWGWL